MKMDEDFNFDDIVMPLKITKTTKKSVPKSHEEKRKDLLNDKDRFHKNYISELTSLVNAMYSKNKRDDDIIDIRDKFLLAKKENSILVMELSGPVLWKYREAIKNKKVNELLKNDYEDDVSEVSGKALPERTKFEQVPALIEKIKRTWHLFTMVEKDVILEKMMNLVKYYASYTGICRELKNMAMQ